MMPITQEIIKEYADKYDKSRVGKPDEYEEKELKEWFIDHRYLDKERFIKLGRWKSKRPTKHYENNSDNLIRDITKLSLSSEDEEIRVKTLLVLKGVSWPVASVILHFAFPSKYPIMDFRALRSLGIKQPKSYNFNFWQSYCEKIREISQNVHEDIRTVEKALWKYSKDDKDKNL
jgi:hypothetical protein